LRLSIFVVLMFLLATSAAVLLSRHLQSRKPKPDGMMSVAADGNVTISRNIFVPEIKEPEWAATLRAKAAKRELDWHVFCNSSYTDDKDIAYIASARPPSMPRGASYVEDGAVDYWLTSGRTQELAARKLTKALDYPPNIHAPHKPKPAPDSKGKGKVCVPDISGGKRYPEKFVRDGDCEDCGK
jgi:hypothetical protein